MNILERKSEEDRGKSGDVNSRLQVGCGTGLQPATKDLHLIPEQRSERDGIGMIDSRTGWGGFVRRWRIAAVHVTNCLFSSGWCGCSFVDRVCGFGTNLTDHFLFLFPPPPVVLKRNIS